MLSKTALIKGIFMALLVIMPCTQFADDNRCKQPERGPPGPQGPPGPTGPAGPGGGALAFSSFCTELDDSPPNPETIPFNDDVPMKHIGPTSGAITLVQGGVDPNATYTYTVQPGFGGVYAITYGVSMQGQGGVTELTVNGTRIDCSRIDSGAGNQLGDVTVYVRLAAGDVVRLHLVSPASQSLSVGGGEDFTTATFINFLRVAP